jgi:sec-independent protein translocase protein TatB
MSLPDTVFIFALALVIFGPKKLPEIGRQLGKLVLEFRRASNEFKMQIEEELRSAEEADRQKKIAAERAAEAAPAADTSGTPTIRPPSTGATESAEAPFKGYFEQEDSVQAEPAQPEAVKAGMPEAEAITPEVPEIEVPDAVEQRPPEQHAAPTGEASVIVRDSEGTLGDYERIVSNQERTVNGHEGLEEQAAQHHG